MTKISRRQFLSMTSLAAVAAPLTLKQCGRKIQSPNDTVHLGVIGVRSKGAQHIERFNKVDNVQVSAICDVDRDLIEREVEKLKTSGESVKTYTDARNLMDDKDIDAVVIAAPNHWHALMTIWACQAGKDVYVEKPVSHTIWEGQQMVAAARKHNRIVQAGTQLRTDGNLQRAFEFIQEGNLGNVKLARAIHYKQRGDIGRVDGPQAIPKHINYDLWTGPAPMKPLMRKSLHYDWHWDWDTGNGELGNNGIHRLDLCRMATQQDLPKSVVSIAGRFKFNDDGVTPNTHIVFYDYEEIPTMCEIRNLPAKTGIRSSDNYRGVRIGLVVHCEDGYFAGGRGGGWVYDNAGERIQQFSGEGGNKHHINFIDAMRARNSDMLNADILEGHLSTTLCHLGNISHLSGEVQTSSHVKDRVKDIPILAESFERFTNHLVANDIQLEEKNITYGAPLTISQDTLDIAATGVNTKALANSLKSHSYRIPFEVPEMV